MKKENRIIAVDFDGTLCENKWPEIGEERKEVLEYVKKEKNSGAKIILWTCRTEQKLLDAVYWCYHRGLIFDAINDNVQEIKDGFDGESRKIFAHEYIDDRMCTKFDFSKNEKKQMPVTIAEFMWDIDSAARSLINGLAAGIGIPCVYFDNVSDKFTFDFEIGADENGKTNIPTITIGQSKLSVVSTEYNFKTATDIDPGSNSAVVSGYILESGDPGKLHEFHLDFNTMVAHRRVTVEKSYKVSFEQKICDHKNWAASVADSSCQDDCKMECPYKKKEGK